MGAGDVEVNINSANAKKCAIFDGTNDEVSFTAENNLSVAKNFTISLWLKKPSEAAFAIISNVLGANDKVSIYYSAGSLRANRHDGSTTAASGAFSDWDTWVHIAFTHEDGVPLLYINGAVQSGTAGGSLGVPVGLVLGSFTDKTGNFIEGCIADVRIYNKVITSAEITSLINGKNIINGLVNRWSFLDNTYNDSVGSNDGTNDGSYISISDEDIAAAISADRTTANDIYLLTDSGNELQAISAVIEET